MQMFGNEYKKLLENGDVLLFARNGIFQARVYAGDRRYVYRSLKTTDLEVARKLALRFCTKQNLSGKKACRCNK